MKTTFPLQLNAEQAWALRGAFRPGIEIDWPPNTPPAKVDAIIRPWRRELNAAILRLIDEELERVEVDCSEEAAWAIDSAINFDGFGGAGADLLIQVLRGLWWLDVGQHLADSPGLTEDPHQEWSADTVKNMKLDPEGKVIRPADFQTDEAPDELTPA